MYKPIPIITLDRLETHDRFQYFKKREFEIGECVQDMMNKKPFADHPFYDFVHARSIEYDERMKLFLSGMYGRFEDVPSKTLIHQARLTKPVPQDNSILFKCYPGTDNVKVIWIIPDKNLWDQFTKGNITEDSFICESIDLFKYNRDFLAKKEDDDLSDEKINEIYRQISMDARSKMSKPTSPVASLFS